MWWYSPLPAMHGKPEAFSAKQTVLLILLPMLGTFVLLRLYLHAMGVRHVYPGGHLIHHLFFGILMIVPAAFLLAFPTQRRGIGVWARVALGIGSALALDEVTYLTLTQASDRDYVSQVSLIGAVVFIALAIALLLILYFSHRD
jgi:hypothetical protein